MRIGIDIDDTITNSYNRILSEFEKYYNINKYMYMNSGISYYDIMKDKETFPDYYDYCKNNFERILYDVPLKHNVKEVLDKLKENNEIIFITARNKDEYSDPYTYTKDYLDRNNIKYDELYTDVEDKGKLCKEINIDIFIDDAITHCEGATKYNIETYLFDNTFNKKETRFKRIYSWTDALDKLEI